MTGTNLTQVKPVPRHRPIQRKGQDFPIFLTFPSLFFRYEQGQGDICVNPLDQGSHQCHTTRMADLKRICVYCGSGAGTDPAYANAARTLGRDLAKQGIELVYGGGSVGLMGITAKSVLDHGGQVTGIIPAFLQEREVMLDSVQQLIITEDMHERKRKMFDCAQAFVALPGGIGTLEELVEMLTWAQLGQHKKPVLLANINGFWDPLMTLLDHMREEEFIRSGMEVNFLSTNEPSEIVSKLVEVAQTLPDTALSDDCTNDSLSRL